MDHGMKEVQCSECAGCGQVVKPVQVWDHQAKEYVLVDRAVTCPGCGGAGKVWR